MNGLMKEYTVAHHGGKTYRVLEDEAILSHAAKGALSPWEAQRDALEQGLVPHRYLKNLEAISREEQIRLCTSRVFVAGCGGLGGVVITLLARLGVGHLRITDGDVFSSSNLNRQWLCNVPSLGLAKARVARDTVFEINPLIEVEAATEVITANNISRFLENMDLVVDALDNLPTRFLVFEASRRARIPFIHGAVSGWWGQVSTFLSDSPFSLKDIYGNETSRDSTEESMGVLGPTPSLVANLQVFEALRLLLGKTPAYGDRLAYFDGETGILEHLPMKGDQDP